MMSRMGVRAAASAVILGIAASGLVGCAAPPAADRMAAQPGTTTLDRPTDQADGLKTYRGGLCRCPPPVHYSDAEIKAISAALRALPDNNPLQQAMSDYENERDNLRICLGR
jgi:hypothetical protein